MSKKKQATLVSSSTTLGELQHIEAIEERTNERPSHLTLKRIKVADQVFQPRVKGENLVGSIEHIKELARILRTQGKPLDPILVAPIGKQFFVIDGHHRLSAYAAEAWKEPIPVEVLDAPLKEAREEALARNIKNKLPMTSNDKFEKAWSLVKEGYTKSKVMEMCTVADGTVANMRRAIKALRGAGIDPQDITWKDAKNRRSKAHDQEYSEWVDKAARKMADNIIKSAGVKIIQKPEVLARALEMISDGLPAALVGEWWEVAYSLVEENKEEWEQEKADLESLDI